jgi:hypothetical protein
MNAPVATMPMRRPSSVRKRSIEHYAKLLRGDAENERREHAVF